MVDREHHHPIFVATFYVARVAAGETLTLDDAAKHHARVRRVRDGAPVCVSDGAGTLGFGTMTSAAKGTIHVDEVMEARPRGKTIHLRVPIGDRDRMLMLAEKATELGVATWQAVRYQRSGSVSPRGEGAAFAEKVRTRMISALEQSTSAWLPQILPDATLETMDAPASATKVLLDRDGQPSLAFPVLTEIAFTFGPEGGLEPAERDALVGGGWIPMRLMVGGTLRFETAGIAAMAVVRATE